MTAGNLFGATLGWHQLHKNTITARAKIVFGIVVHASERVFENILRPPRSSRRTPITSILEELEFKFQDLLQLLANSPKGTLNQRVGGSIPPALTTQT